MNRKNVKFLAIAGMMMALSCGSLLCGNGIVSYEGETEGLGVPPVEITPFSYCETIYTPHVSPAQKYNCLTTYTITQVDPHGTQVEFLTGGSDRYPMFTYNIPQNQSRTIAGKVDTPNGYAAPSVFVVRARCPVCGTVSLSDTSLSHNTKQPIYPVAETVYSGTLQASSMVDYDWIWLHGQELDGQNIYFTFIYKGEVFNDSIQAIHNKMKILNFSDVRVTIAVDTDYICLYATKDITFNSYDTMFAFSASDLPQ